jgi:hypothetical protein
MLTPRKIWHKRKDTFQNQIVATVIMAQDGAKEMFNNTIELLTTIGGNN